MEPSGANVPIRLAGVWPSRGWRARLSRNANGDVVCDVPERTGFLVACFVALLLTWILGIAFAVDRLTHDTPMPKLLWWITPMVWVWAAIARWSTNTYVAPSGASATACRVRLLNYGFGAEGKSFRISKGGPKAVEGHGILAGHPAGGAILAFARSPERAQLDIEEFRALGINVVADPQKVGVGECMW